MRIYTAVAFLASVYTINAEADIEESTINVDFFYPAPVNVKDFGSADRPDVVQNENLSQIHENLKSCITNHKEYAKKTLNKFTEVLEPMGEAEYNTFAIKHINEIFMDSDQENNKMELCLRTTHAKLLELGYSWNDKIEQIRNDYGTIQTNFWGFRNLNYAISQLADTYSNTKIAKVERTVNYVLEEIADIYTAYI
ncbi:hypothetical protein BB561_005891 [Smittium simulii]|uniref:Uncharacterized protein n=1 Tax=Smittium simulii TaxID=133385 RepID=A0A2T9Y7Q2_9FUNG|nr:hypothetical protein BB561_005891 [Smittium simulii]